MRAAAEEPRSLRIGTKHGESDSLLISVEDSGAGIDATDKDRIFEPFFTTKPRGMGLGLSICRSIIEAHGGRLWMAPGQLRGTVFQFSLPVYSPSRS